MELTLYKNSILNDRYTTVFDCDSQFWGTNTPFVGYLKTLTQKKFSLPYTYMKDSGVITVDISVPQSYDIFEYNYMSMVDDEYKVRYYFIDSIEIGNNLVQLSYTLDIWHTYSAKMNVRNGVLGRARIGAGNYKKALPVAYESNSAPQFSATEQEFYLVAEVSEYVLTSDAAAATIRKNFTAFIGHQPQYTETITNKDSTVTRNRVANSRQEQTFTVDEAEHIVHLLTQYQGVGPKKKGASYNDITSSAISINPYRVFDTLLLYSKEYEAGNDQPKNEDIRYDINQIYAVPQSMFSKSLIKTGVNSELELGLKFLVSNNLTEGTAYNYTFEDIAFYQFADSFSGLDIKSHTISANPLTIGYGFRSTFMPYSYNGLTASVQSIAQINDLGFAIGLITPDEGYIDVSSMFEVPLPFTTPSGTERQQQAIAKQQAKIQLATTIATLGVQAATSIAGITTGTNAFKNSVVDATVANYYSSGKKPKDALVNKMRGSVSAALPWTSTAASVSRDVGSMAMSGLYGGQQIISSINAIRSPVSAGAVSNTVPNALVNAAYGFGVYVISPNNSVEVSDAIDKIGYSIYLPTNNYHHGLITDEAQESKYDIVQFLMVEVSGPFSQSIARDLESILMAGFRINYTANN